MARVVREVLEGQEAEPVEAGAEVARAERANPAASAKRGPAQGRPSPCTTKAAEDEARAKPMTLTECWLARCMAQAST